MVLIYCRFWDLRSVLILWLVMWWWEVSPVEKRKESPQVKHNIKLPWICHNVHGIYPYETFAGLWNKTWEMLVGPARALFMDEISTGLDSSTTFQIINSVKQSIHILKGTAVISLLQPAPETYDLFDDIILLSDGQIVYQGPHENVLDFSVHGFQMSWEERSCWLPTRSNSFTSFCC